MDHILETTIHRCIKKHLSYWNIQYFQNLHRFYNYHQADKRYRRRYSPPPIYEDRQPAFGRYREHKSDRDRSYYYDSYGYKHYYSDRNKTRLDHYPTLRYQGNDWAGNPNGNGLAIDQRRREAADIEKKRRKEYLKNICCLFPCCCCCYCRCQKFPKEDEIIDTSDIDISWNRNFVKRSTKV